MQVSEPFSVETFIEYLAVEGLNNAILSWFAQLNEMQFDLIL